MKIHIMTYDGIMITTESIPIEFNKLICDSCITFMEPYCDIKTIENIIGYYKGKKNNTDISLSSSSITDPLFNIDLDKSNDNVLHPMTPELLLNMIMVSYKYNLWQFNTEIIEFIKNSLHSSHNESEFKNSVGGINVSSVYSFPIDDINPWKNDKSIEQLEASMVTAINDDILCGSPTCELIKKYHSHKLFKPTNDNNVNYCYICRAQFSLTNRKHHCRSCGRIFCGVCSNYYIYIDNKSEILNNDSFCSYTEMLNIYYRYVYGEKYYRTCKKCHSYILEHVEYRDYIDTILNMNFDIIELRKLSSLSDKWKIICIHIISHIKEIQYKLHTHNLSDIDKKILINNEKYFNGHSKWLIQLANINDNVDFSSTEKSHQCEMIFCNRMCKNSIDFRDILHFFEEKYNITYKKLALSLVGKIDIAELKCYLSYILYFFRFDKLDINAIINIHSDIYQEVYWLLYLYSDSEIYKSQYELYKCELNRNNSDHINNITSCHDFILELLKHEKHNDGKYNHLSKLTNIYLHFIDKTIIKFDVDNIKIINSSNKPLFIPYYDDKGNLGHILFKREDLRKDYIICNLIKLSKYFISLHMSNNEYLTNIYDCIMTYNVFPINNHCGFIEIIENSATVYDILQTGTINNFFQKKSTNMEVGQVLKNYTYSLAFWSIITFLFGIGDRNYENIMINNNGMIFHIDYSYILNYDHKLFHCEILIDKSLIDGVGGEYELTNFKNICCEIYLTLRNYFQIYYKLLLLLSDLDLNKFSLSKKHIEDIIISKFLPNHTDNECREFINYQIEQNYNNMVSHVNNYIHSSSKSYNSRSFFSFFR